MYNISLICCSQFYICKSITHVISFSDICRVIFISVLYLETDPTNETNGAFRLKRNWGQRNIAIVKFAVCLFWFRNYVHFYVFATVKSSKTGYEYID